MAATTPSTIVLITGANQGIGFETAKKLASENPGYHIIMTGRNKVAVDEAAAKLKAQNLSVEPLHLDVTSDTSIQEAVKAVDAKHGHLDVLINNVGVRFDTPAFQDRATWLESFDINVFGPAMVTDYFLPLLEKSTQTKRIVFLTTSLSSFAIREDKNYHARNSWGWRTYVAAKPALNSLAQHYWIKYESDPTWKINLTCPGYCATNLTRYAKFTRPVEDGAVNACRLATLGPDGPSGTYTDVDRVIPW